MRDHLRFVQIPFGEQRPDRAVDQAAGEDFFFGRAAFALDKAARELARGVGVFAVIDREREKARAGLGLFVAQQAVTSTTESPERTTTAPLACLAIFPVSSVIFFP